MIINHSQLPIEEYHNSIQPGKGIWLSKTSLRHYQKYGPINWALTYIEKRVERPIPGGSEQGQALDCFLTEGAEVYGMRYAIKPDGMSFATKEGKAWREDNCNKIFITQTDAEILSDAVSAVHSLHCWPEIEKAQAQATIRRHSPLLGLGLQSRPDWLDKERGIVWDLKKTRDLRTFGRQAIDLAYHLQAAIAGWCLAGDSIALEHAYLVAVEWERGARARVYEIPQDVLQYADKEMRATASEIADRIKRNDWSDVQPAPEPLEIPGYLLARLESS